MTFIDGHCDTLTMAMRAGQGLWGFDGHLNLDMLSRFRAPTQVFAIWQKDDDEVLRAYEHAKASIEFGRGEFIRHGEIIRIAYSFDDVLMNMDEGVASAIFGLEGAEPIGNSIDVLREFYDDGVRVLTLTWNRKNAVSESIICEGGAGLTPFGLEVLSACNEMGILVDVSHLSDKGFWDVAEHSRVPFVASHSNCKALCGHRRNLSDDQIRAVAQKNGAIGVNMVVAFLDDNSEADIDTLIRHLEHIANIGGIDTPAIGGDLDGTARLPKGIDNLLSYEALYRRIELEFGKDASKIMFANFLRVFGETI